MVKAEALTDAEVAKSRLDEIPGNASLVDHATVERGRSANIEDVLSYVPGVYAASTSGQPSGKISVRGSGLNSFYQGYVLGVKFLYDGVPIGGPGGTQEDLLNSAAVNYTEVLNGTNAFQYAATSLGGAINFVTHTGSSSPGFYGRAEIGRFGYQKYQLSYGAVTGKTDYYVSVLHSERKGFQRDTSNDGNDLIANLGHRFSDRVDARIIYRFREEETLLGSTLTLHQLFADPRQNVQLSGRKKPGTHLLIGKTTIALDQDSRLELGVNWNSYPLHNGWRYSETPQDWISHNVNTSVRYVRDNDQLFGRPFRLALAFNDSRLVHANVRGWQGKDGTAQTVRQVTRFTGSRDTVVSLMNELAVTNALTLGAGLSYTEIDREVTILYSANPNTTSNPTSVSRVDTDVLPRVGLRYDLPIGLQVFGNVSSAVDAPVTWYFGSTGSPYITDLAPQKATTAELGARGKVGPFEGSLAVYRSWVRGELLSVRVDPDPAVPAVRFNASPTIHQGIEAGLTTTFWESERQDNGSVGRLQLRQALTLNDFHYRHDAEFGSKRLPGLPVYLYQAELFYQHPRGFYASADARASGGYYVDFANTVRAPNYTIFGGKLGWESRNQWSVFADFRNVADKVYVAASTIAHDLRGVDDRRFLPGDGFAITGGVSYRPGARPRQ